MTHCLSCPIPKDHRLGHGQPSLTEIPNCLPAAEQHLRTHDPVLASLMDMVGPGTLTLAENRFEQLVESISLGRPNVFPAGDHGVVTTIKKHDSLPETAKNGDQPPVIQAE